MPDLWPHQITAAHEASQRFDANQGGAVIEARMGGGKTRAALEAMRQAGANRIIVVAPKAAAMDVWPREVGAFAMHAHWPVVPLAHDSGAMRAKRAERMLDPRGRWLVTINYEALLIGALRGALIAAKPDAVIFDELHRISNHVGAQMRQAARLAEHCTWRLGLSGTPFSNSRGPLGLWAYYQVLAPHLMPSTFTAFRAYITEPCRRDESMGARPVSRDGRLEYFRFRHLDWHRKAWQRLAWTVPEAPQLDELPEPLDITRHVILEGKVLRTYMGLEKQHVAKLANGEILTAPHVLARMTRLQQLTGGWLASDDGGEMVSQAKRKALEDLLADVDEPITVFARFVHELDQIRAAAMHVGREYSELSGRKNQLASWRESKNAILGIQVQAGAEGISLVESSLGVFWSSTFSLLNYQQARARLQRPGQQRQVRFIHLVCPQTIDEAIMQAIEQRENFVDALQSGIVRWPSTV